MKILFMSDYVRQKAIVYPISETDADKISDIIGEECK